MAILTPSQLTSASNATYFDNATGSITPDAVRGLNDNWISSSILVSQTASLNVLSASYAGTASLLLGSVVSASYAVSASQAATASFYGMHDRGLLAVGHKADLNLIDFDNLTLGAPFMVKDQPAGAQRLVQHSKGYISTIVSGISVMEEGKPTGELPGRLIRSKAKN